jgi:hypothetical protein
MWMEETIGKRVNIAELVAAAMAVPSARPDSAANADART